MALLLHNRPEFNLVDTAALHLGAVPFSLGHPATAEQTAYLIGNAEPVLLITEHALRDAAAFEPVVLVEELDDAAQRRLRLRGDVARGRA